MKSIFPIHFLLILSILQQQALAIPYHSTLNMQKIKNEDVIHSQKLKNLFVQFQKQYLNFEFQAAQTSLQKIVAMRFLKDWDNTERKIIATCYLRLAQMDELHRYRWIKEFFAFSDNPFIDEELFPPQYVDWIKSRHKAYQTTTDIWYGQNLPQDIEAIVINGETFNRLGFSRRMNPKFQYRITLVEKTSQNKENSLEVIKQGVNFSMILNGQDLINYPFEASEHTAKIERKSLDQNKYFQKKGLDIMSHIPTASDMVSKSKPSDIQNNFQAQNEIQKADKKDLMTKLSYTSPILNESSQSVISGKDLIVGDTEKSKVSFFKRHPWVWLVMGGVATGIVLSVTSKAQSKPKIRKMPHEDIIFH